MEDEGVETFLEDEYADYLSDIPSDFEDSESDVSACEIEDSFIQVQRNPQVLHVSSDSEESDRAIELDWSDVDPPRKNEAFKGSAGPNIFPRNKDKVEDVASMFVGDDLLEFIALETNKYHAQNSRRYKTSQKTGKWFDVTVTELKKWFALVIIMGLVRKSRINDYWSSNPLIETPIFSKTMSRNRFRQILAFLHFSDNENMPRNADRLFKIQRIIDYFSTKFKENFYPGQNIFVDEGMIPWRGELGFRVYNPSKIMKYGIFIRMLCDSSTGYIANFKLYSGAEQKLENMIMELLEHHLDKWHHLYMDNFHNSVGLARKLLLNKIRICGTIRSNRGLPETVKKAKLKPLESTFQRKGEILLQLWKTNKRRDMGMISTIHNADMVKTGKTDRKTDRPIQKPKCIIDYNQHIKRIDRADQFLSCYPIYRKTRKWTKKVALYLINCGLFNAFRVYEHLNVSSIRKIKYPDFLLLLSKAWIEDDAPDTRENVEIPTTFRAAHYDSTQRLSGNLQHQLVKICETDRRKRKRCRVCYVNKIRKDTSFMCKSCKVPLHLGECFANYHLKKKY